MDDLDGDISDVEIRFDEGECQCEVVLCRETDAGRCVDIHHHSGSICSNCPGVVFRKYDLMPRFLERDADQFVIRTYLPLEHQLADLVSDLRRVAHEVEVLRIVDDLHEETTAHNRTVDLSQLTLKQRETLEYAFEAGYYESPQQVSLEELADAFNISKSAMFQRLARAERTVMQQILDG